MPDPSPPPQARAPAVVPTDKSLRPKKDAAAQTGASTARAYPSSKKRLRDDEAESSASQLVRRPALDIQSAVGPMVIHISTEDYVLRPADLVAEPWVTEQQVRYIRNFITYTNPDGPWFALDQAPFPASWAVVHKNPRIMHRVHRDQPILFWVVGSLVDIHLFGIHDAPPPTLQVVVRFLRGRDRSQAIDLHNAASSDSARAMDTLVADSASSADEGSSTCDDVYDARFQFEGRSRMQKVNPGRILSGDIVLVECTLVRTEIIRGQTAASFVLNALYWLAEKPRPPAITRDVVEFPDVISLEQC